MPHCGFSRSQPPRSRDRGAGALPAAPAAVVVPEPIRRRDLATLQSFMAWIQAAKVPPRRCAGKALSWKLHTFPQLRTVSWPTFRVVVPSARPVTPSSRKFHIPQVAWRPLCDGVRCVVTKPSRERQISAKRRPYPAALQARCGSTNSERISCCEKVHLPQGRATKPTGAGVSGAAGLPDSEVRACRRVSFMVRHSRAIRAPW